MDGIDGPKSGRLSQKHHGGLGQLGAGQYNKSVGTTPATGELLVCVKLATSLRQKMMDRPAIQEARPPAC